MTGAYYSEIDPFAAEWLRTLILYGEIAPGDVDERSIEDVSPDDLKPYTQCHFFAGIGVWSYALRAAGWPDERPVWTGSCPCQPFSQAGKGLGFADERHLWPAFHHLIRERRPVRVFGEQVEGKDGYPWLDLVFSDLEAENYACGAVPFAAAGVGATDQRHRLYWLANAGHDELSGRQSAAADDDRRGGQGLEQGRIAAPCGGLRGLAHHHHLQRPHGTAGGPKQDRRPGPADGSAMGGLGNNNSTRLSHAQFEELRGSGWRGERAAAQQPGRSFWSGADWLWCRDSKFRPVEPGTFPLDHGSPGRVGTLRGYGGALNAQAAIAFIEASLKVLG